MRTNQMPQGVGKYIKDHKRRKKWLTAVTGMACVVVFCITYALILPAITMESDTYCGFTEHQHGTECFEKRLICGYDETEDASTEPAETGHVHTDDCYEEQQVLVCGLEESSGHIHDESCMGTEQQLVCSENHEHIADCYETVTTYTCGKTEGEGSHTHEAACYETQKVLICEIPESEPAEEPHVHTEDCYEEVLICQLEEHEHSLACRSNPKADVETEADWKKTFANVELTGSCPEDVLAIARTQLGYAESEKNYAVTTDPDSGEEVKKGYTRYGDWYGGMDFAYEDWCAMFVSFCLHYADIPAEEFPLESGVQNWVNKLSGQAEGYESCALYTEAAGYTPKSGDLVFFDLPENGVRDGLADHVGLVSELLCEDAENPALITGFKTIEGNCGNRVAECRYEISDPAILGYGMLPAGVSGNLTAEAMTEEEQAQVREIIARIDALPTWEEIEEALTDYEDAEDEDGYDAYLTEIMTQVSETYAAYSALTDAQRAAVTNADKLLTLAEWLGINAMMTAEEPAAESSGFAAPGGGFMGYVSSMEIKSTLTGSEPFDADNNPGNDSSATNDVVRTFDTIFYEVAAAFAKRTENGMIPKDSELNFEISMEKKITEARFDLSAMTDWLDTGYTEWEIDYWAKDENDNEYIALVERKDGEGTKLYRIIYNDDGTVKEEKETSINAMVLGSTPTDGTAYQTSTGGIIRQSLIGKVTVCPNGDEASGTQNFSTGIRVRNAKNGDTFTPSFKAWFTKNPNNYGTITDGTLTEFHGNQAEATVVTVSCAPLYNLTLAGSTEYVNYLSWYDFSSGDEVKDANLLAWLEKAGSLAENYGKADPSAYTNAGNDAAVAAAYANLTDAQKENLANIRYGRMNALGVTMSLASESGADSAAKNKGYKGCSLPVGNITFDLALGVTATAKEGDPVLGGYSAILWDYRPNVSFPGTVSYPEADKTRGVIDPSKGNMERNLRWRGIDFSQYGSRMAVGAYRGSDGQADTTVYDSGFWNLTQINGADATESSATSTDRVYTFTVHDYDFDLDNYLYPDRFYGAADSDGKLRVTDFAFFGGFAQVLYVMPYANSGTVDVSRNVTVGNLEATNLSGQTLNENITHGKNVSAAGEANESDNTVTGSITQYSVGDFTKRSSFNTTNAKNHTIGTDGQKSFLGSDFWGEPQWDENIYAGSDISIMGSAQLSTTSDNTVRAVNLLQLFDSKVLSITPKAGTTGDYITQANVDFGNFYENTYTGHDPQVTYLFAADPDKPLGYDTNAESTVSYMNLVREEDLVYADKLYWNEADQCYNIVKYTINGEERNLVCVGVLSEVRNCNYIDYCYVRIPVTVADKAEFVNKTVCTVNATKVWIDEGAMNGVSWKSGQWDSTAGKNVPAGYVDITYAWDAGGNGYYSYNEAGSFSKIEYNENGGYKSGTAGKHNGASLLILGYKARVNIDNRKNLDSTYNTYSPATGETSVTWVVKDIATDIDTTQGTAASATTSLTIPVNLTYGGNVEARQQELFYIAANSSTITEKLWVTDTDGNLQLGNDGKPIPVYETDAEGNQILDANNNPIQKTVVKSVSTDSGNPTTITFLGTYKGDDGVNQYKLYTYQIYAQRNTARTGVTYYIDGAPVGQALPDISFNMNLGNSLVNNDSITATAAISGSGDRRAYSEANGNQKSNTIGISKTGGSLLSKAVDTSYGEINTSMGYTVTFTNNSSNSLAKAYFYDNLPYNGDGRGSVYDMGEDGTATDGTIVKEISFRSVTGGALTNDFQATVTVYYPRGSDDNAYSKMSDLDFKNLMYGFKNYVGLNGAEIKEEGSEKSKLDALLESNQFGELMRAVPAYKRNDAGQYLLSNGTATDVAPTDATASQYQRTASYRRTLAVTAGWLSYDADGNEVWTESPVTTVSGNIYPNGKAAYEAFLSTIPGVVVKVENMGPNRSIEMNIQFGTNENKAGDVYSNDAWQWSVGSTPLQSNTVPTEIVGRTISGRVWADENLNGLYDDGEKLLSGVICTLFKLNETTNQYEPCTQDVAGRRIGAVTTGSYTYSYTRDSSQLTVDAYLNTADGEFYRDTHGHEVEVETDQTLDGQYSFDALPEGKYIVAFSGGDLDKYGGATSYQINLKNDENSNDGVALFDTEDSNLDKDNVTVAGFDNTAETYKYVIAYDLTDGNVGNVELHSIGEIAGGGVTLTNFVELYDHQDLGLVNYAGFEFPETGGAGTALYTISGLSMAAAGVCGYRKAKKRKNRSG